MDKDFDDIDDAVLKDSSGDVKAARTGMLSTRQTGRFGVKVQGKAAGLTMKNAKFNQFNFSEGFKALVLIGSSCLVLLVIYILMRSQLYGTALVVGTSGMIIFFLYLFTGGIDRIKMNGMVVFCYIFAAAALIGAILPFFYFDKVVLNQEKMMASPLGVIKACVKVIGDEQVPPEMDCKRQKSQWVLNIGGTVEEKYLKECDTISVECINREKRAHPERYSNNNTQITGGIVIPLYILVLAIMGAAVNMTRRVPEYQRQVALYQKKEEGTAEVHEISSEDAREFMVFQLMQVVSAPVIAITAYYIIVPQTPAVSIVLGVVSGFAAETVLVALRAFADKLMPSALERRAKPNGARRKS